MRLTVCLSTAVLLVVSVDLLGSAQGSVGQAAVELGLGIGVSVGQMWIFGQDQILV